MNGTAPTETGSPQEDQNFSAALAKAKFPKGIENNKPAAIEPSKISPTPPPDIVIEPAQPEEFNVSTLREAFGLNVIVDSDAKTAEVEENRRKVVDAFLQKHNQEIEIDEDGETLAQLEIRLTLIHDKLPPEFEDLRSKAIQALTAQGIQDPERVLHFYELQKFGADIYLFNENNEIETRRRAYLKDSLRNLYRTLEGTADDWQRRQNFTQEGDQLVEQFKILDQNPEILNHENVERFVALTAGHLDSYSFDFVTSQLAQLSQIPQDRFGSILQLVKERYTFLWPGNIMDDDCVQKIEFIFRLIQHFELLTKELLTKDLQTLDVIQASSRLVSNVFKNHPLIKSATLDQIFANATRFQDELTVLEQVIYELDPQNTRYRRADDIKDFLSYFQEFSGDKVFGRINELAEQDALEPLVNALNSGWQLDAHINDFDPRKRANIYALNQDVAKLKPVEPTQQNGDEEAAMLTTFLRDVYKTQEGGVESSWQIDRINEILTPQYRNIAREFISLAGKIGDNPEQRRKQLIDFCYGFNTDNGLSFHNVRSALTTDVINNKLSGNEKEFWLFWNRLAGYLTNNEVVQSFLVENKGKFNLYVQDQEQFGGVEKRFMPEFIIDSLSYIQRRSEEIQNPERRQKFETQMRNEFFKAFFNHFPPVSLDKLARIYGSSRKGSYAHEQEAANDIVAFLSSHSDEFFKSGNPQWNVLIQYFSEPEHVNPDIIQGVLRLSDRETENHILLSLPENDQKFLNGWMNLSETIKRIDLPEVKKEIFKVYSGQKEKYLETGQFPWSDVIRQLYSQKYMMYKDMAKAIIEDDVILQLLPPLDQKFWNGLRVIPQSLHSVILRNISVIDEEGVRKIELAAKYSNIIDTFPKELQKLKDQILDQIIGEGKSSEDVERNLTSLVDIYNKIRQSPSKEIQKFQDQIIAQLASDPDPVSTYQKIESVFVLNNLPEVGKIYRVFEILNPPGQIEAKIGRRQLNRRNGQAQLSPVLTEASSLRKYDIIYRDLLKVHIDSANPSLYRYLKALQEGEGLIDKAETQGYESLDSRSEAQQLTRFLNRMDTLYANSLYGRRNQQAFDRARSLPERVDNLRKSFHLKDGESLTARVARMFVRPLGFDSVDQVIARMDQVKSLADARNRAYYEESVSNNGGKLKIEPKDLLKGVRSQYLETFFQNGSVAKEYLGADASSDTTPFDTDVSRVLPEHITGSYRNIFNASLVGSYGDLIFVFRNRGEFQRTNANETSYDKNKYELFYSGYHGARHYGIRTGIASTEIDALVVQNGLEKDRVGQQRLFFDIANSGFYIPVSDQDGNILFTPEDYERYRLKKEAVLQTFSDNFQPRDLLSVYKQSPYLAHLYEASVGVSEGYSLEQHTQMMMGQFEKYFAGSWISPLFDRNKMRITLSIHDLGKPLSVQMTGSTKAQHEYTLKFAPQIFDTLGFSQKESEIATALIDQDYLGDYIKGRVSTEQTARSIQNKAIELGVSLKDFTELLRVYYMSDAGSYTADVGGKASLDRLFSFKHENEINEVHFSPEVQERFSKLLESVYLS